MSLDASRALPSTLKSFALTHILYDPTDRTAIPLTLLSLSPIFLFVAYFTLAVFTRRLSVVLLALGSVGNEALSLALKRWLKGERPYKGMGLGEVGDGYGMPSSHSQAAGFVCAWGVGYALASQARRRAQGLKSESRIGVIRRAVYVVGLIAWSALVAYSRWHLLYHSPTQVIAGYTIGLVTGGVYFTVSEYLPLQHPASLLGKIRELVDWLWTGVGGVGGFGLGDAPGGFGEGHFFQTSIAETTKAGKSH